MKTSALCAAALTAAAFACPARAAAVTSGLQLKISGRVGFLAGAVLTDSRESGMDRDYDFASGARLQFDVVDVTDSGLEYGGRLRFSNVDRRNDVVVDRSYIYVKGAFGTITLGDSVIIADDIGTVYAHQTLAPRFGLDTDWADGFRSPATTFSGSDRLFAVAAYDTISGLNNKDTRIKYVSPTFGGLTFGIDFTPVVGGDGHAGTGSRADLTNDSDTLHENVVTAGANYTADLDGVSVLVSGTASTGNGVSGHRDLAAYSLGTQVAAGDVTGSLNWVHYGSIADSGKAIDTVAASLAWRFGDFEAGLGYAWTMGEKGNGLTGDEDTGDAGRSDLRDDHIAAVTLVYTLAPGLNTYAELSWETAFFRQGPDFNNTVLVSGLVLGF